MINSIASIYSNKVIAALIDGYADDSINIRAVFWTFWKHPNTAAFSDFYNAYHDRVVDLSGAFFHLSTHFVRPVLNTQATFDFFLNTKGKVVKVQGRSYAAAILDLERAQRSLDNEECNSISPVIQDFTIFSLHPSFGRGIKADAIHYLISAALSHRRFVLEAPHSKKTFVAMNQVRDNNLTLSLLLYLINLFNSCSASIQEEEYLLAAEKREVSFDAYIPKVKRVATSIEGQAFLYRWMRFEPENAELPIRTTLIQTQLGDFRKKYLSHPHPEIRALARHCLTLFKFEKVLHSQKMHVEEIKDSILFAQDPKKKADLKELARLMNFTSFPPFLDFLSRYYNSRISDTNSKLTHHDLRTNLQNFRTFIPSIRLLYHVTYNATQELIAFQKKKTATEQRLPAPDELSSETTTYDTSFIEELDSIEDAKEPSPTPALPAGGSEGSPFHGSGGAPATAGDFKTKERSEKETPHATATGIPVVGSAEEGFTTVIAKKVPDPIKHIRLERDFPLKPLKYDDRVRAHFKQLAASGKSYSAASHDIQVHAYSPLVDRYVGTVYSLRNTWTNTQTKNVDIRYLLPAQLTLPGQRTRDVVFRYTQGADGVWYHRDLTYRDETQLWHQVNFPKPQAAPKNKKTWTVESPKGTESYDPHTETILLELEDGTTIRLFRVR